MPDNNNNVSNDNVSAYIWPTDNVITDLKFGTNEEYEIGIGNTTQEFLEEVFGDIDDNFGILNTTIEENEETISNALNDLNDRKANKADMPVVPTNVSAFTNDAGYLTQHQDISAYFNDVEYDSNSKRINFKNGNTVKKYIDATDFIKDGMVDTVTVGNVTIDEVLTKCLIITFNTDSGKQDINIPLSNIFDSEDYYTKDDIDDVEKAISSALNDLEERKLDASELDDYYTKSESDAKYLTSADASDDYYTKDEIDDSQKVVVSALNELKSDLELKVDSNDLAIVAISGSYNDLTNKPTVTNEIVENSTALITSGGVYEVLKDNEYIVSSAINDLNDQKADKTDIPIVPSNVSAFTNDAGYLVSSDISGKADKIPVVQHGTNDTTFELTPNVYHIWGEVASLTLTLGSGTAGYVSEYMFEFQSGSNATSLSLPNSVIWVDTPIIEGNMTYQVSILNNIALIVGV